MSCQSKGASHISAKPLEFLAGLPPPQCTPGGDSCGQKTIEVGGKRRIVCRPSEHNFTYSQLFSSWRGREIILLFSFFLTYSASAPQAACAASIICVSRHGSLLTTSRLVAKLGIGPALSMFTP